MTRLLLQLSATEGHSAVENHPDRMGSQQHSEAFHWIVLDGPMTPLLLDTITTLLTGTTLPLTILSNETGGLFHCREWSVFAWYGEGDSTLLVSSAAEARSSPFSLSRTTGVLWPTPLVL